MRKTIKKRTSRALLFVFWGFVWGYSLLDAVFPLREYSALENRNLATAPRFSWRALASNDYTADIEEFTNDQFAFRDMWITLKSLSETALLKTENNGIVYGKEGYMFEKRYSYDAERLERNIQVVEDFAEKYPGSDISLMVVPTSDQILTDLVPRGLNNLDQKPLIEEIYKRAQAAGIKTVDMFKPIGYYRTDHHWTAAGAWEAYRTYTGTGNAPPATANTVKGFFGTYYSKAKYAFAKPDEIIWYDMPVESVTVNGSPVSGLYDTSKFLVRDKYAAYLHGNNGITVINTGNKSEKKILMFKDSFGNSFAPYLCLDYAEITVVDLRYFMQVEQLMKDNSYDEILILYSFPSFSQESSLVNLRL